MDFLLSGITEYLYHNKIIFIILISSLSFILTNAIIPRIVVASISKKLTVTPNERSSHSKNIPHLGGLGIILGAFLVISFFGSFMLDFSNLRILLASSISVIILLMAGIKDDIMQISPFKKLLSEIFAALIFILITGVMIDNFYGIFGIYKISPFFSVLFTIFVFIIIINSFNLIDGIDALASFIAVFILSIYLYYFISVNSVLGILISSSTLGSLLSFLRFNITNDKRKVFMGDVGSLVIGSILSLLTTFILSTEICFNSEISNLPVLILSLFSYPFLDTLRVFIVRGYLGISPFSADKIHIHHKLLNYGYSHLQSSLIIFLYSFNE